jgi:uncharacterized membrane protein YfcA
MPGGLEYVLVGLAAVLAGGVNALAGGGTLITFPMLMAVGVPAIAANVTNTVALCPGYLGATLAQAADLSGQKRRLWLCLPAGAIGGILGGLLLLTTSDRAFRLLVPYLILLASGLLAVQEPLRRWLVSHAGHAAGRKGTGTLFGPPACADRDPGTGRKMSQSPLAEKWAAGPVALAAVYGGYFGAGLSVIVMAALGLTIDDSLTRLNALKQAIALIVNTAAAVFFLFSGQVVWSAAVVMALGAIVGGTLGGRLAGRIRPNVLRTIVVLAGVVVGVCYLVR